MRLIRGFPLSQDAVQYSINQLFESSTFRDVGYVSVIPDSVCGNKGVPGYCTPLNQQGVVSDCQHFCYNKGCIFKHIVQENSNV